MVLSIIFFIDMEESHKIDAEREILECLFNQIELLTTRTLGGREILLHLWIVLCIQ